MNLEPFPINLPSNTYYLSPGYVAMSLVSPDNELVYPMGNCKEYILDYTLYTMRDKPPAYVMAHVGKACLDEVRLAVSGLGDSILASLDLIHKFENVLDMPPSVVNQGAPSVVVFRGNSRWMIAPPMLSLYGLLVRAGRAHTLGRTLGEATDYFWGCASADCEDHAMDVNYLRQARSGIEYVFTHGDRAVFGTDMRKNWEAGNDIHSRGIIAFSQGSLRSAHPEWYRLMK